MPNDPVALALLKQTGPLAVSSANTTGDPAATTAQAAQDMLGDAVAVYLDGGPTASGTPSTILDATGSTPRILRAGAIGLDVLHQFNNTIEDAAGMREYLVVVGIALGVTYLLASIARTSAHHLGAVARVRDRDAVRRGADLNFSGDRPRSARRRHPLYAALVPRRRSRCRAGAWCCWWHGHLHRRAHRRPRRARRAEQFAVRVLASIVVTRREFVHLSLYGTDLGLERPRSTIFTVPLIVGVAKRGPGSSTASMLAGTGLGDRRRGVLWRPCSSSWSRRTRC